MKQLIYPRATYRLQFRPEFPFEAGADLAPYLKDLGISHVYASPVFEAMPGSSHGYDITDYTKIRNELGGEEGLIKLAATLREKGIGLILDFVPNHMAIGSLHNRWWRDVLENGRHSFYADFFDVDWETYREELRNKVLLPILGDQYGIVLERGEIRLGFSEGSFFVQYYDHNLPVRPYSYAYILELSIQYLGEKEREKDGELENIQELKSIARAARNIPLVHPPFADSLEDISEDRLTEFTVIRRRLRALQERSSVVKGALQATLALFNPSAESQPKVFDPLHELLEMQHYRLCYWKVATEEINYRRFFDINHLGAVRMEVPVVFERTHALLFRLIRDGVAQGVRVDHPDGLYDPISYFEKLQAGCYRALEEGGLSPENFYIVVEKILEQEERLPVDWKVDGTTGYHFLNSANRLYTDPEGLDVFREVFAMTGRDPDGFESLVLESKLLVMRRGLSGEIHSLANRLERISEKNRRTRDFTLPGVVDVLQEVIASFPVYRTYSRKEGPLSLRDEKYVGMAVNRAIKRNPSVDRSIYEFIRAILKLELPSGMKEDSREELREFVMRFQQMTGPIAAKGIEDTAFYNYHLLVSLNEVGGRPDSFSLALLEFHKRNKERQEKWPLTMNASTTHDTKRSEDVRDRINALTEIPGAWKEFVLFLEGKREGTCTDQEQPSASDRYLLYQTLVGSWPMTFEEAFTDSYRQRIRTYMVKATREAKRNTSWIDPDPEYENCLEDFVNVCLQPDSFFASGYRGFHEKLSIAGILTSVSRTLIKMSAPGVPDFYQGTEVPSLTLVDPDNRNIPKFSRLQGILSELTRREKTEEASEVYESLVRNLHDGYLKLYTIKNLLIFRKENPDLFRYGQYAEISVAGDYAKNWIVFARSRGTLKTITLAGRFFLQENEGGVAITALILPKGKEWIGHYREIFTGLSFEARETGDETRMEIPFSPREMPAAFFVLETTI